MSFISTGVEYALHCLLYLVSSKAGATEASVRDLAELQGISTEYLAKIFTKLAKAELVVATEGIKGGFRLARAPEKITVLDVVVAVDGGKTLFDCREIRSRCAVFEEPPPAWTTNGTCSIHAVMLRAEKAMNSELESHSLADLAERTIAKAPASYGLDVVHWLTDRAENRRGDRAEQPVKAPRRA